MSFEVKSVITPERIEQLAKTGAIQLPLCLQPRIEIPLNPLEWKNPGTQDIDLEIHNQALSEVIKLVLALAGEAEHYTTRVNGPIRRMWIPKNGKPHKDDFGEILSVVFGLGVFKGRSAAPINDELVIMGRGISLVTETERFTYANGPVLMAQRGFGEKLVGFAENAGNTWHMGDGSKYSGVAAIDIFQY
ncbi:hypothetical protein KA075_02645 [Candidatus Saccharibacteria bacterium]|jgi:hypothetical protein|nr:hypothetical protein [Candidatus Saccharibacteria bacterium]